MARIRTVKPGLFAHEVLFDLEQESGLPVRLAFIGLFTVADREGRFHWRPRTLKKDVLPHDDIDFSRVLDALATRGLIVKYTSNGEVYGCIPTFGRHQVINNRESGSEIPSPSDCETIDACPTRAPRALSVHKGNMEGKGREEEGKGTELSAPPAAAPKPKPKAKSRSSLPDDFPAKPDQDWAQTHWLGKGRADLCDAMTEEIEKFRDHHRGKATMSADWPGSWRTWARNAMNFTRKPNGHANGKQNPHRSFLDAGIEVAREYLRAEPGDDSGSAYALGGPLLPP